MTAAMLTAGRAKLLPAERRLVRLAGRFYHWTRPPGGTLRLVAGLDPESQLTIDELRKTYESADADRELHAAIDGDLRTSADGSPSSASPNAGEPERATSGESAPI